MHIAALPPHPGQYFPDRCLETRVIVADHKLHTAQPSFLQLLNSDDYFSPVMPIKNHL